MGLQTSDVRASLTNLFSGAVVEAFDAEMEKVYLNILDPNTSLGVREVTLKVKIKPSAKNRGSCAVSAVCTSKTLPDEPISFDMFIGKHSDGTAEAREINSTGQLPFEEPKKPQADNVKQFNRSAENGGV